MRERCYRYPRASKAMPGRLIRLPLMCRGTTWIKRCFDPSHGSTVTDVSSCGAASWATPWTSTLQPARCADRSNRSGTRRVEVQRVELGAGTRTEHDGVARELVVHGHDEGQAVARDDRDAADRLGGQKRQALLPRELLEFGWLLASPGVDSTIS